MRPLTLDKPSDATTQNAQRWSSPLRGTVLGQMLAGPLQVFALVSLLALLVALALLVTISWRGLQRLEPFTQHLEQQRNLLALNRSVQELIAERNGANNEPNPTKLAALRVRISALLAAGGFADPTTPTRLRTAARSLDGNRDGTASLHEASALLQDSLASEARARRRSISAFHATARVELVLATIAVLVLPATALLVLVILRERITRPLRDLNALLALLGDQSLRSAPVAGVVMPLQPIMENYNQLVAMLAEALGKNKSYQAQLESQVRAAAETLLRQRIELAEADRLSAIGEMSARVAHELRNPLAGIQVGLANLVQDTGDADQRERLQLIAAEVARMARLLDQLLVPSRRHREQRQEVEVRGLVLELLELARYQIPAPVELVNDVPESLTCWLQRDAMRQMLLNLVLNASQALGERSGAITVTATREAQRLRIAVLDDGPGFPSRLLEDGPRPFYSSRTGGYGLGLSTVARMARSMGGELKLHNRTPSGAAATLSVACTGRR